MYQKGTHQCTEKGQSKKNTSRNITSKDTNSHSDNGLFKESAFKSFYGALGVKRASDSDKQIYKTALTKVSPADLQKAADAFCMERESHPDDGNRRPVPELADLLTKRFWLWPSTRKGAELIKAKHQARKERLAAMSPANRQDYFRHYVEADDPAIDYAAFCDLVAPYETDLLAIMN